MSLSIKRLTRNKDNQIRMVDIDNKAEDVYQATKEAISENDRLVIVTQVVMLSILKEMFKVNKAVIDSLSTLHDTKYKKAIERSIKIIKDDRDYFIDLCDVLDNILNTESNEINSLVFHYPKNKEDVYIDIRLNGFIYYSNNKETLKELEAIKQITQKCFIENNIQ